VWSRHCAILDRQIASCGEVTFRSVRYGDVAAALAYGAARRKHSRTFASITATAKGRR